MQHGKKKEAKIELSPEEKEKIEIKLKKIL